MFDLKEFESPSAAYRAKAFWSLNGRLKKEELKKQILCFKKMGFGGIFLHSRVGLKTEYMGKEWLDLCKYCTEVAEENGLETYLYDEDRWPSGTCGGMVTKDPTLRAKALCYKELSDDCTPLPQDVIAIFAVKLDGEGKTETFREIKKFSDRKEGERVFSFFVQTMLPDTVYNGTQTIMSGSMMRFYEYMDFPGVDNLSAVNVGKETLAFKPFNAEFSVKDGKMVLEIVLNRNNCFGSAVENGVRKNLMRQGFYKFTILKKRKK